MNLAIEVKDIACDSGPLALDHVSLTVEQGEFLGVVGPNSGG